MRKAYDVLLYPANTTNPSDTHYDIPINSRTVS